MTSKSDIFPSYQQHSLHPNTGVLLLTKKHGVTPTNDPILVAWEASHIHPAQGQINWRHPFIPPIGVN
jgi:hypothetical protein